MNKSLKTVNEVITDADPNNHSSVSYTTYFRNLTKISNSIIDEKEEIEARDAKLIAEINNLPDSISKTNLLAIMQGRPTMIITHGGTIG